MGRLKAVFSPLIRAFNGGRDREMSAFRPHFVSLARERAPTCAWKRVVAILGRPVFAVPFLSITDGSFHAQMEPKMTPQSPTGALPCDLYSLYPLGTHVITNKESK